MVKKFSKKIYRIFASCCDTLCWVVQSVQIFTPPHKLHILNTMSDWSTGVCGCMGDSGVCCDVLCCPFCQIARQAAAIEGRTSDANWCCCILVLLGTGACGSIVPWCVTCNQRGKIRGKYGIAGGSCGDCIVTLFCTPCTMCQQHKELLIRGTAPGHCCCAAKTQEGSGGGGASAVEPKQEENMT